VQHAIANVQCIVFGFDMHIKMILPLISVMLDQ